MPRTLAEAETRIAELEQDLRVLKSTVSLWRDARTWEEGCRLAKKVRALLGEPDPTYTVLPEELRT